MKQNTQTSVATMASCCTVVWFRRDLRLEDNPALVAATRSGLVIPLFIWTPEEEGQFLPGRVSRWWMKQSLTHLQQSLASLGAPLVLRRSKDALSTLLQIAQETGASRVFYNHLYDPVSLVRDHRVKQGLIQAGISVSTFNADLLYEPWEINDNRGLPYTTFSEFWSKCMDMPTQPDSPLLPPKKIAKYPGPVFNLSVEDLELEDESDKGSNALLARAWAPGWANADKALVAFMNGPLIEYAKNRQKVDSATTSLLSPHLHYGELSIRKVFRCASMKQVLWVKEGNLEGEESVNLFLRSIGFREYSRYLSFNFPFTHERSLLSNLKNFPWRVDEGYFKIWRQGRTGYPLVDAGMRELWATGWLHNRVRVIVSSFFVKFLQLPWRWGMKYFWDTLLDADLECDVLGWQYISGSLPDGHELDRIDNPQTEGYKYDPYGEYVRRWLPELSRLPSEWIHHPWDAPPNVLRAAGVELGTNYPRPIVEEVAARQRLEQALRVMWQEEAAEKAAMEVGMIGEDDEEQEEQVEGRGDNIDVQGRETQVVENMDMDNGGDSHDRDGRNSSDSASHYQSPHDQMVPNICTQSGKRMLSDHFTPEQSNNPRRAREAGSGRHELGSPSDALQDGQGDAISTAESSSTRRDATRGNLALPRHLSQMHHDDTHVPLVPEVVHQGVLSRRRNNNNNNNNANNHHTQPLVSLEAIHATKV